MDLDTFERPTIMPATIPYRPKNTRNQVIQESLRWTACPRYGSMKLYIVYIPVMKMIRSM